MDIEKEIKNIKQRNKKVELNKKWETSFTRRIFIAILTYLVVLLYSYIISKGNNIWFSSLVPVLGFILSTLSLKYIRKLWEKKQK